MKGRLTSRLLPFVRQASCIMALCSLAGLIYALHQGDMARIAIGLAILQGVTIGLLLTALEIGLSIPPLREWMPPLPFSLSLVLRTMIYAAVIIAVNVIMRPHAIAASIDRGGEFIYFVFFSIAVSFLLNFIVQTANLAGGETLMNFMTGRYHRPREERRFVLFVDVVGSTALAERHGSLFIHAFLDRTFRVLTEAVLSHSGEVLGYIGDELIVTWPEKKGAIDARALRCFCDMRTALLRARPKFEHEFGSVPCIRGSLNFGSLTIGETGAVKRAIVFNGDVMNTAARLEESSRHVDGGFVASRAAIERLEGVLPCELHELGNLELRGRQRAVEAFGLGYPSATGKLAHAG